MGLKGSGNLGRYLHDVRSRLAASTVRAAVPREVPVEGVVADTEAARPTGAVVPLTAVVLEPRALEVYRERLRGLQGRGAGSAPAPQGKVMALYREPAGTGGHPGLRSYQQMPGVRYLFWLGRILAVVCSPIAELPAGRCFQL